MHYVILPFFSMTLPSRNHTWVALLCFVRIVGLEDLGLNYCYGSHMFCRSHFIQFTALVIPKGACIELDLSKMPHGIQWHMCFRPSISSDRSLLWCSIVDFHAFPCSYPFKMSCFHILQLSCIIVVTKLLCLAL
ncbi:hypothetical protein ID866_12064 [Astraeus odoratus]|nr:hypothetical protein ID866_12064 [Astraeus odoratus]